MAFHDSILSWTIWWRFWPSMMIPSTSTKGACSETISSNSVFSFDMAFSGSGIIPSYPPAAAVAKDLKGCISGYPNLKSHDQIVQWCMEESAGSLTVEKRIHQVLLQLLRHLPHS
ncbi:hypothetical protein NMG60_11033700 [Bertholletia excelsa]